MHTFVASRVDQVLFLFFLLFFTCNLFIIDWFSLSFSTLDSGLSIAVIWSIYRVSQKSLNLKNKIIHYI